MSVECIETKHVRALLYRHGSILFVTQYFNRFRGFRIFFIFHSPMRRSGIRTPGKSFPYSLYKHIFQNQYRFVLVSVAALKRAYIKYLIQTLFPYLFRNFHNLWCHRQHVIFLRYIELFSPDHYSRFPFAVSPFRMHIK